MIQVVFFKDVYNKYIGISLSGHAGFADYGYDVVCAGVSALAINLVNSVETLTNDKFIYESVDGYLKFIMSGVISIESNVLINSCILGIRSIEQQYGKKFINIKIQEVK